MRNMTAWCRECKTHEEIAAWFQKRADEFRSEGATWFLMAHHPDDPTYVQINGYKEQPEHPDPLEWPVPYEAPHD